MEVKLTAEDLGPIVAQVVDAVLARVADTKAKLGNRLSFSEAEAADLLGCERHTLRDARLRGEIKASKVGKRIFYRRETLEKFLLDREM